MVMLVTKGRARTFVPFELNLYYYSWLNDQPGEWNDDDDAMGKRL